MLVQISFNARSSCLCLPIVMRQPRMSEGLMRQALHGHDTPDTQETRLESAEHRGCNKLHQTPLTRIPTYSSSISRQSIETRFGFSQGGGDSTEGEEGKKKRGRNEGKKRGEEKRERERETRGLGSTSVAEKRLAGLT